MPPVVDPGKCTGCGTCREVCSEDVFGLSAGDPAPRVIYSEECWHCYACVTDCPEGAITLRIPLPMMVLHK